MKELSIEEKAKRYDGAIKRAKNLYKDAVDMGESILAKQCVIIFPELKESEDEMMVKFIKKQLFNIKKTITENYELDTKLTKAIDWLEKQGEQKSIGDLTPQEAMDIAVAKYFEQAEQKPSDTRYEVKAGDSLSVVNGKPFDYEHAAITQKDFASKDEPKFKAGDWIANSIETVQITGYDIDYGYQVDYKGNLQHRNTDIIEKGYHLWSIADAKDGDVLAYPDGSITLFRNRVENLYMAHFLWVDGHIELNNSCAVFNANPATKEQCDLLFQKMREEGYEWDAENKELKKIEDENYNGEDYGIDSLFHAQRILEKTLGKVDGYQTDDGILSHKCAITAVKKLYRQKSKWSDEDEELLQHCCGAVAAADYYTLEDKEEIENWLKSLKQKMEEL